MGVARKVPERFAVRMGAIVKALRDKKGWTQRELAEQAGISSHNQVSRLEMGYNVEVADYFRCARALGCRDIVEMVQSGDDPMLMGVLRLWPALDESARRDALRRIRDQVAGLAG